MCPWTLRQGEGTHPISPGYIASSRIAYGTYPMHRICSHILEALQYGTPTVTAHDNVAHSGKAGCCTIHTNIHMIVYVIPAVVTLIDWSLCITPASILPTHRTRATSRTSSTRTQGTAGGSTTRSPVHHARTRATVCGPLHVYRMYTIGCMHRLRCREMSPLRVYNRLIIHQSPHVHSLFVCTIHIGPGAPNRQPSDG